MTVPKIMPAQVEALKAALEKVDTLDLPTAAEFRGEGWGDEAALAFALAIGLAPLLLAEREELLAQRRRWAEQVARGLASRIECWACGHLLVLHGTGLPTAPSPCAYGHGDSRYECGCRALLEAAR